MVKRSLQIILDKAKTAKGVIIVGAGVSGRELLKHLLEDDSINVIAFFDNDSSLHGQEIEEIPVQKPCNMGDERLYILTVNSIEIRKQLRAQLEGYDIDSENIVTYFYAKDYEYYSTLDKKYYKEELSERYESTFNRKMNWEHPSTYTEIINWEKLNINDARRARMADKVLVRDWVKEKIGEQYLTKWYGVWDNVDDIDFSALPNAFTLKTNNGSGRNIIVKDKTKEDLNNICSTLNEWKNTNYAYCSGYEMHYRDIIPKIICEEYLVGLAETVYDYNIYCFHGKPEYIWCIRGSHRPDCHASFYNEKWEIQPFHFGYPYDPILAPRPEGLEEMLALSRVLCREFDHVRVDWYNMPDGRILFGEMTFSPWAGLRKFEPDEYDLLFGNLINRKKQV